MQKISNKWWMEFTSGGEGQFFLLNGRIVGWNDERNHREWLETEYGIPADQAELVTKALPRGRAADTFPTGLLIEASPGMESYQNQITKTLKIDQMDRPKWSFEPMGSMEEGSHSDDPAHYTIDTMMLSEFIRAGEAHSSTLDFINMFLPTI